MKVVIRFIISCLVCLSQLAIAAPNVSSQQLEMFKQLSPQQQQALINQYRTSSQKTTTEVPGFPDLLQQQVMTPQLDVLDKSDIIIFDAKNINGELTDIQSSLLGKNVFTLNQNGELALSPYNRILLKGLTLEQAALKLMSSPELKGLQISLQKIGNKRVDSNDIKPFGYDFFTGVPTSFAPATDIPVPVNYVIGPADVIQVSLFGNKNQEYHLSVSREGILNFPEIGPIAVAGLKFDELKKMLLERISKQMIGVKASISIGPLRSIRVFVLGDVNKPGSYTVSSLSTITNALFLSGGVKKIGSLRNIQLKRNGKLVGRFDLYDLLLRGDSSKDKRLLPGDVIFIPPVGKRITIEGEVVRPAIYEAKSKTTIANAIQFAGGFTAQAYPQIARLQRINKSRARTVLSVDLTINKHKQTLVRNGDKLRVSSVLENKVGVVALTGYAERNGVYQWQQGMRLTDLIPSVDELLPKTDLGYVLIKRESMPERKHSFISIDLLKAINNPKDKQLNPFISERDTVYLFSTDKSRNEILEPIFADLHLQSSHGQSVKLVSISGRIKLPGRYPLEVGMRISDLLRAGGSLQESAYPHEAEISRQVVANGQSRQTQHFTINLASVFDGDKIEDLHLKPYDHVIIKEIPLWREKETVSIKGEVKFPGEYTIKRGETLKQLIERVGGLTDQAYAYGAVFMRKELQEREQQQLDSLATRLESDLSAMALEGAQGQSTQQAGDSIQSIQMAKSLVTKLRNTKAAGRMVIDLNRVIQSEDEESYNVLLKDGDTLVIPKFTQEVTIIGEVQHATSHLFDEILDRDDYINRSGGLTYKADDERIYIVRANGQVVSSEQSSEWFADTHMSVRPGDTIVVPLDAERMRPLTFWTNITQIFYQLGVAAAAWQTVGVF